MATLSTVQAFKFSLLSVFSHLLQHLSICGFLLGMQAAPISQPPLRRLVMSHLLFKNGISDPCGTALVYARRRIYAITPPLSRYSCSWLAGMVSSNSVATSFNAKTSSNAFSSSSHPFLLAIVSNWNLNTDRGELPSNKVVLSCRHLLILLTLVRGFGSRNC